MSKLTRREFLRLSTVAAAGVLAAACAKTEAPTATPQPEAKEEAPTATPAPKAEEPTATPAEAAMPWPREDVPRSSTLIRMFTTLPNVGIVGMYAGGNHQASGAAEQEAMFYYEALSDKMYSHLAESYEYNDDATELTINLRKGVEWSDGTPFTAKDIAFTYNTLIERSGDYRDSARIATLTEKVEAVDDYTVLFYLNEPNFRYHFTECTFRFDRGSYIVPEHIFKDVEDWREFGFYDPEQGWPVVTAAWQTTIFETQQSKTLDLRYDWWAAKTGFMDEPDVKRIIHLPFTEETVAAEMIINNEIDHCLDLRPRTIESILAQASDHIITFTYDEKPYGYVDWWPISMYFNTLEAPYDDPRVRWAIAYAIDQQQLVEVGWAGAGQTSDGPFPYYPGLMKYIDTIKDIMEEYNPLEVDLDKSADLMIEAGFEKDSEGFWVKDGKRPDTDIWAGVPLFGDIAPVTAEQLRKAGFDAKHVTPPDVWAGKSDGRAMLHFFGHGGSVRDPFTTLDMYNIREQKPTGEDCGPNRPRWGNEEYSEIVDELSMTSPEQDEAKAMDLFRRAMEIWYKEMPEVPLVQWFHRIPQNTTYWDNWPTRDNPYNSALWHLTMPITLWNLKAKQ